MPAKGSPPQKIRPPRKVLPGGPKRFSGSRLTRAQRRNRWLVGAATIGAHVAVFTALFWHYAQPPRAPEPPTNVRATARKGCAKVTPFWTWAAEPATTFARSPQSSAAVDERAASTRAGR